MKKSFNDTAQFILNNFAHTMVKGSKSFHGEYRIDADKIQIESLTGGKFNNKGDLKTKNLWFKDSGISISFFRMVTFNDLTCVSRR